MKFSGLTLFVMLFVVPVSANAQTLAFQGNQFVESNTGYTRLSWDKTSNAGFELQQSSSRSFKEMLSIYKGRNNTVFISGLKNGRYFYRVRSLKDKPSKGSWSDIKELRVVHHSLKTAFFLFLLGLTAFVFTIIVIFKGHFQHQKKVSPT